MRPTSIVLNILWIVLGGFRTGLAWARAAANIGVYSFFPFGRAAVRRDMVTGRSDIGTGPLGAIGNIIWFLLVGWVLALIHLATTAALAITIIGLPFACVPTLHLFHEGLFHEPSNR